MGWGMRGQGRGVGTPKTKGPLKTPYENLLWQFKWRYPIITEQIAQLDITRYPTKTPVL